MKGISMRITAVITVAALLFVACGKKHEGETTKGEGNEGGTMAANTICGTIELAPELAAKFKPGAVLFVFAKNNPGGGPPAAVRRETVQAFPVAFCLSQKDTMVPGLIFQGNVYLTARIDADGQAGGSPGDLEGITKEAVAVGTQGLKLTIDTAK